jgi:LmbE family N-acetylglucosaminyl deacetylase
MEWIYLSPHFDDVAFSCGGLIWEQVEAGITVSIWTICAGEPPPGPISSYAQSLHERWGTGRDAVVVRRAEDLLSSQRMGARSCNFSIPDAIYRRSPLDDEYLYTSDPELFIELRQEEGHLVESLQDELNQALPQDFELVCPLALGGHVDHRLVRSAAERLGKRMWYYADYPYTVNPDEDLGEYDREMLHRLFPVSERGLTVWQQAVAAHSSQISTFWSGTDEMRNAIRAYWKPIKGTRLWYFAQDMST